jgi:hypothetical protein
VAVKKRLETRRKGIEYRVLSLAWLLFVIQVALSHAVQLVFITSILITKQASQIPFGPTIKTLFAKMSDPVTYSFYGTTLPVLRNIAKSAISTLTAAKSEYTGSANLPSEGAVLDAQLGDMLPLRMQPIILAKFPLNPLQTLQLSSADSPNMDPSAFKSFDDVIAFFQQLIAVYDSVDEKAYNEAAEKGFDIEVAGKTLHMSSLADHYHSFAIPNCYFHLNSMYMLLRSKGFSLGKTKYVGPFMSETTQKDWAPLHA